jgi:hypothetical protein
MIALRQHDLIDSRPSSSGWAQPVDDQAEPTPKVIILEKLAASKHRHSAGHPESSASLGQKPVRHLCPVSQFDSVPLLVYTALHG